MKCTAVRVSLSVSVHSSRTLPIFSLLFLFFVGKGLRRKGDNNLKKFQPQNRIKYDDIGNLLYHNAMLTFEWKEVYMSPPVKGTEVPFHYVSY